MSSDFELGAEAAREMIQTRGVAATRKYFDSCFWVDDFDRGFESVLLEAESRHPLIENLAVAMADQIVAELRVKYAPSEEAFADKRTAEERLQKAKQALVEGLKNGQ